MSERGPKEKVKVVIKIDLAEVGAWADEALDRMRYRRITRTTDPATARVKKPGIGRRRPIWKNKS